MKVGDIDSFYSIFTWVFTVDFLLAINYMFNFVTYLKKRIKN